MTHSHRLHVENATTSIEPYFIRLFIAGGEANSCQALHNLTHFVEKYLPEMRRLDVIDVLKDYKAALKHDVFVTPTLILLSPVPKVTIIGNLNDTHKVLTALRLNQDR